MATDPTGNDTSTSTSARVLDQGKHLVREGTIQRVIVKRGGETIVHIPVIAIIAIAVVAPWLVAIGALVALLSHCTITVQRADKEAEAPTTPATTAEPGTEEP
jgi:ABC-type transport system involved in Fe-S cluster assembly fused permease/ATPase subunit